jgi:hypothetical protein
LCTVSDFSEGYAGVILRDGNRGPLIAALIDKQGNLLANKKYAAILSFQSGQAIAATNTVPNHKQRFGVVDHTGNFVIPPQYDRLTVNDNKTYIATTFQGDILIDRSGKIVRRGHIFDTAQWSVANVVAPAWTMENGKSWAGLRSSKGWITEPTFDSFFELPDNRWIAIFESKKFDQDDWKMQLGRTGLFNTFLASNNLIGMRKSKIMELLGEEESGTDWVRYSTANSGGCWNAATGILIQFAGDRIKRWRISSLASQMNFELSNDRDWFSENVIFVKDKYVPKAQLKAIHRYQKIKVLRRSSV